MNKIDIKPQDTRFAAIILGLVGGALDVYSHIQFDSFVATQTGNIVVIMSNLAHGSFDHIFSMLLSIFMFSVGFLFGIFFKDRAKTAFWRIYSLLPLLIVTILLPFIDNNHISLMSLAFSTGIMMLTFSGSKIEEHPYTIFMTSGNYRKMISTWYIYFTNKNERDLVKRKATNYTIVVLSFIIGALGSSFMELLFHKKSIWLMTLLLFILVIHYVISIKRRNLEKINI